MRLLKVGRSLGEARDRPHRYKLLNHAMPTFGTMDGMKGASRSDLLATADDERANEPAEIKARVGSQTMKTQTVEVTGTGLITNAYALRRWTLSANPFKSAKKSAARLVVQGELSLDKVKVVRNDLSDSDLELVAARRPVATANPENVFLAGAESNKPSLLARVKSQLFRAPAH